MSDRLRHFIRNVPESQHFLLFYRAEIRVEQYLPKILSELAAAQAIDEEVNEAVEDSEESDNVIKHKSAVTGKVAVTTSLIENTYY